MLSDFAGNFKGAIASAEISLKTKVSTDESVPLLLAYDLVLRGVASNPLPASVLLSSWVSGSPACAPKLLAMDA